MMRIYKEFGFEAAHHLPFAPAGHPNSRIHGHSFRVRVYVEGRPDPTNGIIFHFEELENALDQIKQKLDHRFLNDIEGLETPTLETITKWMWDKLVPHIAGLYEIQLTRPSCGEGCIYNGTKS